MGKYYTKSNKASKCSQVHRHLHSKCPSCSGEKKKRLPQIHSNIKTHYYIEIYKIPLLNTSCLTLAKWEDYCWKTQGIMRPAPSPWWMSGLHSGIHTALFSTEDADFQRRKGLKWKHWPSSAHFLYWKGVSQIVTKGNAEMKSPPFSNVRVAWWCDCLTVVTRVQQSELEVESLILTAIPRNEI